jgi:hypothetical protein
MLQPGGRSACAAGPANAEAADKPSVITVMLKLRLMFLPGFLSFCRERHFRLISGLIAGSFKDI